MGSESIFRNLSPLDHRYRKSNEALFDRLSRYLSEEASVRYCTRVELALLRAHLSRRALLTPERDRALEAVESDLEPEEVYAEEERTQHNVRALVNVLRAHVDEASRPYVHLGATSVDILDTAMALRVRDCVYDVLLPELIALTEALIELADGEADTPQIGRTHGRHGIPITFGYAVAEYVARLGKSLVRIRSLASDLRGKLSGAVGAYNALGLIVEDPQEFEKEVLGHLRIEASEYASQIVEPEYLLRLLLEANVAFGVIGNLADDLRHLQRSEIDEVREGFGNQQVGSSTMPQKRNPWNCEHVKSLWKAFSPRVVSFFMDQISEHQRDLSNSASSRFIAEYVSGFVHAVSRMSRIVRGLYVNRDRMYENLRLTGDLVLSEPLYILLSQTDHPNAHEELRGLTLESEQSGRALSELIRNQPEMWERLGMRLREAGFDPPERFFEEPERYSGKAANKAREICARYRSILEESREEV